MSIDAGPHNHSSVSSMQRCIDQKCFDRAIRIKQLRSLTVNQRKLSINLRRSLKSMTNLHLNSFSMPTGNNSQNEKQTRMSSFDGTNASFFKNNDQRKARTGNVSTQAKSDGHGQSCQQKTFIQRQFDNLQQLKQLQSHKEQIWSDLRKYRGWQWDNNVESEKQNQDNSSEYVPLEVLAMEKWKKLGKKETHYMNGEQKDKNSAQDQGFKHNFTNQLYERDIIVHSDSFVHRQQDQLYDLDFRKTKLFVYYNQKYKMIERRASSLVYENKTLREFKYEDSSPEKKQSVVHLNYQGKTYSDTYVNLTKDTVFRFQMNAEQITTTFVYELNLDHVGHSSEMLVSLDSINDYLRGCDIIVEQQLGHVSMTVSDQDPTAIQKSPVIEDKTGSNLRFIYFCHDKERRPGFSKQFEKVSNFEQSKQHQFKSRDFNGLNVANLNVCSQDYIDQNREMKRLRGQNNDNEQQKQMNQRNNRNTILVYINLTALSPKCLGKLTIVNTQVHRNNVPFILQGRMDHDHKDTSPTNIHKTPRKTSPLKMEASYLQQNSPKLNIDSIGRQRDGLNTSFNQQRKDNFAKQKRQSKFLDVVEQANQRSRIIRQKNSSNSNLKQLSKVKNLIKGMDEMNKELYYLESPFNSKTKDEDEFNKLFIDAEASNTARRASVRQMRRTSQVHNYIGINQKFQMNLKNTLDQRIEGVKHKRQQREKFFNQINTINQKQHSKPFRKGVTILMQQNHREIRNQKLMLAHWVAQATTYQCFSMMKKKIILLRVFMTDRLKRRVGIKRIQRFYRSYLEYHNTNTETYGLNDDYSCFFRVAKFNYRQIVCINSAAVNIMNDSIQLRAKKLFLNFMKKRVHQINTYQQLMGKSSRTYDLLVMCQRQFRYAMEVYRRSLLERALKLDFSLQDLHPDWLIEKIAKGTFENNLKNKMSTAQQEAKLIKKIMQMNKHDLDKQKLKVQVQKITGKTFSRFDQLYLKKLYIERLNNILTSLKREMDGELTEKQQRFVRMQSDVLEQEKNIIQNELNIYFKGQGRGKKEGEDAEFENPFSIHRNYKQRFIVKDRKKAFEWEDMIHFMKKEVDNDTTADPNRKVSQIMRKSRIDRKLPEQFERLSERGQNWVKILQEKLIQEWESQKQKIEEEQKKEEEEKAQQTQQDSSFIVKMQQNMQPKQEPEPEKNEVEQAQTKVSKQTDKKGQKDASPTQKAQKNQKGTKAVLDVLSAGINNMYQGKRNVTTANVNMNRSPKKNQQSSQNKALSRRPTFTSTTVTDHQWRHDHALKSQLSASSSVPQLPKLRTIREETNKKAGQAQMNNGRGSLDIPTSKHEFLKKKANSRSQSINLEERKSFVSQNNEPSGKMTGRMISSYFDVQETQNKQQNASQGQQVPQKNAMANVWQQKLALLNVQHRVDNSQPKNFPQRRSRNALGQSRSQFAGISSSSIPSQSTTILNLDEPSSRQKAPYARKQSAQNDDLQPVNPPFGLPNQPRPRSRNKHFNPFTSKIEHNEVSLEPDLLQLPATRRKESSFNKSFLYSSQEGWNQQNFGNDSMTSQYDRTMRSTMRMNEAWRPQSRNMQPSPGFTSRHTIIGNQNHKRNIMRMTGAIESARLLEPLELAGIDYRPQPTQAIPLKQRAQAGAEDSLNTSPK